MKRSIQTVALRFASSIDLLHQVLFFSLKIASWTHFFEANHMKSRVPHYFGSFNFKAFDRVGPASEPSQCRSLGKRNELLARDLREVK